MRLRLFSSLALLLLLLQAMPAGAERVRIVDDRGREVVLQAPAKRIAPLYGGVTDILLALGVADSILARTSADDAPAVADVPEIGTHMRPNVEMLVGLGPDLVIQMGGRKDASLPLEQVERHGIPTAFFQARNFDELFSVLRRISILAGVEEEGGALAASMRARLDAVAATLAGKERPGVFFEVRYPNLLGAGRGSMVDAVIHAAGGRNVLDSKDKLVRLNEEALLALDPEVCLVQQGPMNPDPLPLDERDHFRTLSCVREGRFHVVDEKRFSRPGPQSVEAVELLAGLLHEDAPRKEIGK